MSEIRLRPSRMLTAAWLALAASVLSVAAHATTWKSVYSTVATRGIASNGHVYVAAATNGIWTSSDLKTWTRASLPSGAGAFYDEVIWDGSRFLAAGFGIISSTDGATWTTVYQPNGDQLFGLSVMGGIYVAVGAHNLILDSTDGKSWHKVSSGLTEASGHTLVFAGIGNDGIQFVASGEDYTGTTVLTSSADLILTSPDGVTWTSQTVPSSGNGFIGTTANSVAIGGSAYFAGGFLAGYSSADGVTWSLDDISGALANPNANEWLFNRAAYLNGQFLAIGLDAPQTAGSEKMAVFKSSDGLNWTAQDLEDRGSSISGFSAITYHGGTYVAAGYQGVYSSTDASHWTKQFTGSQTALWSCVITGNGRDIVMGSQALVTATAGGDWPNALTKLASQSPSLGRGCGAYGAGVYVMAGDDLYWSSDGKSWTLATVTGGFSSSNFHSVAWTGSEFVALTGDGTGLSSTNGKTWSHVTSSLPSGTIDLSRNGFATGAMIAGGSTLVAWGSLDGKPLIMTSSDGASWIKSTLPNLVATDVIASVAFNGGAYVAIGNKADGSTLILVSSDAKDWQEVSSSVSSVNWESITWGSGEYLAVGVDLTLDRAAILSSSDGKQWTESDLSDTSIVNDVAWDGSKYVVAGAYDIEEGIPASSGSSGGGNSGGTSGGSSGSGGGGIFNLGLFGLLLVFTFMRRCRST
ncbi:MAG TPA: hypothetical protein VLV87_06110 [Gammaproteobacteria bacterium]|nr:hypothetical protein [Gammaproteobacteria bacterium]